MQPIGKLHTLAVDSLQHVTTSPRQTLSRFHRLSTLTCTARIVELHLLVSGFRPRLTLSDQCGLLYLPAPSLSKTTTASCRASRGEPSEGHPGRAHESARHDFRVERSWCYVQVRNARASRCVNNKRRKKKNSRLASCSRLDSRNCLDVGWTEAD